MNVPQTNPDLIATLMTAATVSVPLAGAVLGVSRSQAYTLAKEGEIPVIRVGTKGVRVPTAKFREKYADLFPTATAA